MSAHAGLDRPLDRLSKRSWIDRGKAAALAEAFIKRLRIKTDSRKAAVRTLSGGNAQKVVFAKWLATEPDVLILDEPTAGIDIGSSTSTFQHYEHDPSRGFVSGGHIAVAGVGIPLPINWRLPGSPSWGAEAKKIDREAFSHSLAVTMVLHDMPQQDNRIELDDEVLDAWSLPIVRVTLKAHQNDLDQGRYLIDRGADILEASGARSVTKVYATRVTGNCSHQHGTARMGNDPDTSVLNRWCRAHEVENLHAVDGSPFPTGTGANPTLTIMANAWRVAAKIVAEPGGGREGVTVAATAALVLQSPSQGRIVPRVCRTREATSPIVAWSQPHRRREDHDPISFRKPSRLASRRCSGLSIPACGRPSR